MHWQRSRLHLGPHLRVGAFPVEVISLTDAALKELLAHTEQIMSA